MAKELKVRFQQRIDEAANWTDVNPILLAGEIGIESDTKKFKFGDGTTKWSELHYAGIDQTQLEDIQDGYHEVVPATKDDGSIQSDSEALATIESPVKGDIAVVKRVIAEDGIGVAKSYTAYVYTGEAWAAMEGNYDANNVYFSEDITLAGSYTAVGNVTKSSSTATGTLSAKDKSLAQIMQSIFTKELYPATGNSRNIPNISLSGDSNKTGEVGAAYDLPTVTVKVDDVGAYTYGPATGIVFETGNLTIAQGAISSATNKKSNDSNFGANATLSLTATDTATIYTDSAKSYTFNASGTYTQGAAPKTNLGNLLDDNDDTASWTYRIPSGTATATARTIKRTGWRNYWYGFISTTDTEGTTISRITDSTNANYNKVTDGTKTLTAGGAAIAAGTLPTITAAAGDRMPVVLIPTASGKKVSSATMPSSLNAPVTFVKSTKTVNLAGLNGATAVSYDLWYYKADDMPVGADFSIVIA